MEEETTTPTAVDPGAQAAQPVEPAPVEAVEAETPVTSEQQTDAPTESAPDNTDAELADWASKKGLTLDSENATKAAKMAREAERAMHQKAQKASELEKATQVTQDQLPAEATPQDVDNARLKNLELKYEISNWKNQNQDKLSLEADMVKVLSDPTKKALVQEGYLSLDDVYALARASSPDNSAQVKSEGKREALESLAHKQQAAVPTGHATNPGVTPKEKPFAELSIEEMEAKLGKVRQ